ncbi:MAG: kinase [Nitrospirota bacterium]|nr:kinase [Nitrospirota bacterium]
MIICRTPFRVSFLGGGTDYPVWYHEHGGAILGTTIDKYCYITCRYLPPFFEHKTRIAYSKIETVASNEDIEHPAVRGVLQYMKIRDGLEIHHDGDLPAKTGIGSSSSFTVSLLHALYALKRVMPTKMQLAKDAIYVEQEILKENVGCQDQVLAAHGGLCKVDFFQNDDIRVMPIILPKERLADLQSHLMLFFTGFSRRASEVAKEQVEQTKFRKVELKAMHEMVDEGVKILAQPSDFLDFGRVLHEGWGLKRSLTSRISSMEIDSIYEKARKAGALGGKLLGAGGGGFILLFAKPENHPAIKKSLRSLLSVPFKFEARASQIMVYEPGDLIKRDYPTAFRVQELEDITLS